MSGLACRPSVHSCDRILQLVITYATSMEVAYKFDQVLSNEYTWGMELFVINAVHWTWIVTHYLPVNLLLLMILHVTIHRCRNDCGGTNFIEESLASL